MLHNAACWEMFDLIRTVLFLSMFFVFTGSLNLTKRQVTSDRYSDEHSNDDSSRRGVRCHCSSNMKDVCPGNEPICYGKYCYKNTNNLVSDGASVTRGCIHLKETVELKMACTEDHFLGVSSNLCYCKTDLCNAGSPVNSRTPLTAMILYYVVTFFLHLQL